MYGVLLLPYHGEPTLVTAFSSRREFLAAMNVADSPGGWLIARQHERAVYEINSPDEAESVLREVLSAYPDQFEACAEMIAQWIQIQERIAARRLGLPTK